MGYEIPDHEPSEAHAGSSWFWDASYPDFPASAGWQLNYYLRGPVDKNIAWTTHVTADGDDFAVRVPADFTDDLTTVGGYQLTGRVSKSGEVHVVYDEHLRVLPDPLTAVNAKSWNRRMLEALQTRLEAGATDGDVQSLSINGRSVTYRGEAELRARIAQHQLAVTLEENPDARIVHEGHFVDA